MSGGCPVLEGQRALLVDWTKRREAVDNYDSSTRNQLGNWTISSPGEPVRPGDVRASPAWTGNLRADLTSPGGGTGASTISEGEVGAPGIKMQTSQVLSSAYVRIALPTWRLYYNDERLLRFVSVPQSVWRT